MISVVLFDLDDTLFAHRKAVADGIVAHTRDELAATRWHELEERHYPRYLRGEMDVYQQRRVRVREFVAPTVLTDGEADEWFGAYFREYQRAWTVHDDTLPCLGALRAQGLSLGLITNGDLVLQTAKLDAIGLAPWFSHVIASGAVGVAKPDKRIFEIACSLFGVAVSDAVYVGDRLQTDAIGASTAGLTGVWLARGASADDIAAARASGVRVISTLAELAPLIAAL